MAERPAFTQQVMGAEMISDYGKIEDEDINIHLLRRKSRFVLKDAIPSGLFGNSIE
jgi:hypothetical protein